MVQKLGGVNLGIKWNTENDQLSIPFTVNISERKKRCPTGKDTTLETIREFEEAVFTRRICQSITMGLCNLLGFNTPLTLSLSQTEAKKCWDTELMHNQRRP